MESETEKENIYYVYLHIRKDNNEVFYIGKGKNDRATWVHSRNKWWNNIVSKAGGFTVEYVEKNLFEDDAFDLERELIKFYKDCGYTLCNLTDGGEGTSGRVASAEQRAEISRRNKGMKHTDEARAKISAAHMGNQYNKGRKLSEEHKAKIRAAGIGNKYNVGRVPSAATREKLSKAGMGRKPTDATREKISKAKKGIKLSEEQKEKLRKTPVRCSNGLLFCSYAAAIEWLISLGFYKASISAICACCNGRRKTAYGFTWSYPETEATEGNLCPDDINPESEPSLPVPPLPPTTVEPSELVAHLLH